MFLYIKPITENKISITLSDTILGETTIEINEDLLSGAGHASIEKFRGYTVKKCGFSYTPETPMSLIKKQFSEKLSELQYMMDSDMTEWIK